ncbi:hypothetical protein FA15DRAFT_557977, partial [Coprinopsis marcescibilis]
MVNPERLYATLIFRASRKYASWDPEIPVEVGDYGIITSGAKKRHWKSGWRKKRAKEKGVFMKEGNVFKEGVAQRLGVPDPVEFSGKQGTEGVTWITSKTAKEVDLAASGVAQTPAFVNCQVKAAFQFGNKAGAVLVMRDDTIATIQPPAKLRFLYDEPSLRGKVIVSEVHKCSSYARFVGGSKTSTVALGLSVTSPIPEGVGDLTGIGDVQAGVEGKWVKSSAMGNFKTRTRKDGKRVFSPLFRLVALDERGFATGLRGGDSIEQGDGPLPDAVPPWIDVNTE